MSDDEWSQLSRQVSILCDGWSERREYVVQVNDHDELRIERIWHPPLLVQLRNMTHPLVKPKQEGGGGAKPGSKPPGAFQAAALIDEVRGYAQDTRMAWTAGNQRVLPTTIGLSLLSLVSLSSERDSGDVHAVTHMLRGFIRRARVILGHDVPTRAFADTVCGECGGELRAPIDGAGPVFCSGTALTSPCGLKYTSFDIIRLAIDMEAVREETSRFGTGGNLLDDAAQAG